MSWHQNVALIGENGLTPAKDLVDQFNHHMKSATLWTRFQNFHSLFLFLPPTNFVITLLPLIGIILTLLGLFYNCTNVIVFLLIYGILQSIYSIGNIWFNYSYELELMEVVFMSLFLVPFVQNSLKQKYSTTIFTRFIARFFVFKVLFGSGLIRIKNEQLWTNLLGKYYIYETHPLPTITSYFLHYSLILGKIDNIFSIFVEMLVSIFLLIPIRFCRIFSGSIIFIYCIVNFLAANSYLFYFLLLAPLMFCFDDAILLPIFCKSERNEILNIVKEQIITRNKTYVFFKSFDLSYVSGISVEELHKMRDTCKALENSIENEKDHNEETKEQTNVNNDQYNKEYNETTRLIDKKRKKNETNETNESNVTNVTNITNESNETIETHGRTDGESINSVDEEIDMKNILYTYENKKSSFLQNVKIDIQRIYEWVFQKKGIFHFVKNEKEQTYEIGLTLLFAVTLFIYNFVLVTIPINFLHFFIFLLLFLSFIFYLFLFVENKILFCISEFSILIMLFIIYSNQIFFYGFRNIYYTSLFTIYILALFYLSSFYLKNNKFICTFSCQYFYFLLFLYFFVFYIQNIISPNQVMNTTYGHFELMNVYGSFGKIKKQRQEIIIQGTTDTNISEDTKWKTYEFYCKPTTIQKRPCTHFRFLFYIIPIIYIDRLDWQFSLLTDYFNEDILEITWFKTLLKKLEKNEEHITRLFYTNPFQQLQNNINNNNNDKDMNELKMLLKMAGNNNMDNTNVCNMDFSVCNKGDTISPLNEMMYMPSQQNSFLDMYNFNSQNSSFYNNASASFPFNYDYLSLNSLGMNMNMNMNMRMNYNEPDSRFDESTMNGNTLMDNYKRLMGSNKNNNNSQGSTAPRKSQKRHRRGSSEGPPSAEILNTLLYEKNLSVPQIAHLYGVHRTTVARWCHNRKIIHKSAHRRRRKKYTEEK